jgi:cytochrome P450
MDTMREVAVPRIEAWPDGGTLALDRELRSITLTVLTRTLLSSDIGSEAIEEIERLLRVLLTELLPDGIIANIPALAWVPTRSNRRFAAASRRLGALLTSIIDRYREAGADHGDLMSILMRAHDDETGTGMTGKQLRDEATTLVIAGSETTGNTLAWACYLLAQHPEVANRLHQEAVLALPGGDASYEALDRLPFTRAVVTETLRLYSPVWVLPRQAAADVDLGGYQLPAKSRMLFSPYALNRDARLHREAGRFDPDRWAAGYSRMQLRASFFPFGQGIRKARRRRRRQPRGQQHAGAERTPHHRDQPPGLDPRGDLSDSVTGARPVDAIDVSGNSRHRPFGIILLSAERRWFTPRRYRPAAGPRRPGQLLARAGSVRCRRHRAVAKSARWVRRHRAVFR